MKSKVIAVLLAAFSLVLGLEPSASAAIVGTLKSDPAAVTIFVGAQATIDISSPDSIITTAITATSTVAKYASVTETTSGTVGHTAFVVTGLSAGTSAVKVHAAKGYADLVIPVSVKVPTLSTDIDTSLMSSEINNFSVSSSSGLIPVNKNLVVTSSKSSVVAVATISQPSGNQVKVQIKAGQAGVAKLTLSMAGYETQTYSVTVSKPGLKADKMRLAILPGEFQYVDIFSTDTNLTTETSLQIHGYSASQLVKIERMGDSGNGAATFAISVNSPVDTTVVFKLTNFTEVTIVVAQPTLKVTTNSISLWQKQKVQVEVTSDDSDFLAGMLRATVVDGKDGSLLNFASREVSYQNGVAIFEIEAPALESSATTETTQFVISSTTALLKPVTLTFIIRKPILAVSQKSIQMVVGESTLVSLSSPDVALANSVIVVTSTSNATAVYVGVPRGNQIEIHGLSVGSATVTFEVSGYAPVSIPVQVLKTAEVPTAPAATVAPTISGTAKKGSILTANKGAWSGSSLITYVYAWYRCTETATSPTSNMPSTCSKISGAAVATYTLTAADVDKYLRVLVTGTNGAGSSSSASKSTAKVTN